MGTLHDDAKSKGRLSIVLYGPDGQVKDRREIDNLIVTSGLNWRAARMIDPPPVQMSHMAIGTGAAVPTMGDTALGAQAARVGLSSQATAGAVTTYQASFGAGVGTGAITEAGIFNAAANGTMLNRATFPVVNKGANDTMAITWTVTQQ